MLKLTDEGLKDRAAWTSRGYALPAYDRAAMKQETLANPKWIHFGAGNIFRAFQANAMQKMLNKGEEKAGIIAVDGFDYEIIEKNYRPHDNLSVLVTLKADGTVDKTVVGSIGDTIILDTNRKDEYAHIKDHKASDIKDDLRYADGFLDPQTFLWETKANLKQKELDSLCAASHIELFVRKVEAEDGLALPFTYIGSGKMHLIPNSRQDNGSWQFRVEMKQRAPQDLYFDFQLPKG